MLGSLPCCDKTSGERSPIFTARKRLTNSSGNGASRRRCCWGWLLTAILLHTVSIRAQTSPQHTRGCGCPDGRRFSTGASLFGKNSARVLVTGFRPQPPASASGVELTQCTELLVLGQVIRLLNTPDGRPFLKRESLKRGVIHNICDTKIHFMEAKKSYNFFEDDGSALTLTGNEGAADSATGSVPEESAEVELDENLTGRDLLQLIPPKGFGEPLDSPDRFIFDEEDLKEGAYLVCTRRSRVPLAADATSQEVTVVPGTFGRIEKRSGFRSEPLWTVEVLPGSAPQPFWRSLISIPRMYAGPREPALPRKVILASSRVIEINHLLDRSGVEWTRFGDQSDQTEDEEEQSTHRWPEIYAPPELPLEENIATAQTSRIFAAIRKTTHGLHLAPRNPEILARRGTLVLEERTSPGQPGDVVPDLLRRQCFVGLDGLGNSQQPAADASTPELVVTGADVKVFRPKDYSQVPPGYYAIDLRLQLRPNFSAREVPLVCRFPSVSIDLALLDMAERILSSQFEIHRAGAGSWPKN
jgi:hypothetical protein